MDDPEAFEIPTDGELQSICAEIIAAGNSPGEWAAIESCGQFQTGSFCGGFDATEMEFCFSWFTPEGGDVWFQFPLDQAKTIAEGLPCKLLGRMQSNSDRATVRRPFSNASTSDLTVCPRCQLALDSPVPEGCTRCGYGYLRAEERADLRRGWRGNWLSCIFEFASLNFQEVVWIGGSNPDWPVGEVWVSSHVECMCSYFNDLGLVDGFGNALRDGVLSEQETRLHAGFHASADGYAEGGRSDREILEDPKWHQVVRAAGILWASIKEQQLDREDLKTIDMLECRFGLVTDRPKEIVKQEPPTKLAMSKWSKLRLFFGLR